MKIVFLINSLTSGGAEKVVLTLLNKLIEEKYDIELICLEKDNFYKVPKELKITYLSSSHGKTHGVIKLLSLPYYGYKLYKYTQNHSIDIVHSHLYRANYVNVLAQLFGSKHKSQIVNHGIVSRYKLKGILGKINLFLIKKLYSRANLIVLISNAMKIDLNSIHDFKNQQIVINNPYNINDIIKLKNEKIENFIFDKEKKYLITMGRLIALKRYQDVINSMVYLNNDIELIVLGNGDEIENLKEIAFTLNISQRIHFIGNVQNPFKYLERADIFILSSETEGFPNSIIEALACVTTVISSDCISGPREILSTLSSVNRQIGNDIEIVEFGVLYPVGRVDLLVKSIELILIDYKLRNRLKGKSLNRANDFSINRIINTYKKVLEIE